MYQRAVIHSSLLIASMLITACGAQTATTSPHEAIVQKIEDCEKIIPFSEKTITLEKKDLLMELTKRPASQLNSECLDQQYRLECTYEICTLSQKGKTL